MERKIFTEDNIVLNADFNDKTDAIKACGQILVDQGYCKASYIDDMLEREKTDCVYIGNGVAIPHGLFESDDKIMDSGISFLQVPNGVKFPKGTAYMLIGIAGKNDEHMEILAKIAMACSDMNNIEILKSTTDKKKVCEILTDL